MRPIVEEQTKDVARFAANDTLKEYDRGVRWQKEDLQVKGKQWKTAYLPVWLYSYQQIKGEDSIMHYVAVNARTKETMGSVPIHMPKLFVISCLVELIGIIAMILASDFKYRWIFLLTGIIYFFIMHMRYRNSDARHYYETETKKNIFNLNKEDNRIKRETGLTRSRIEGANNTRVSSQSITETVFNTLNNLK